MTRLFALFLRMLCAVAAGVVAIGALAATNVGGPITVNTAWTLAGAPYTATSDVTVDAGAMLTIEAGVTVFMNPGTNLVIRNGALAAQGTATTPIVLTSYRDIANPNPAPAPGDWGQLVFQSGTIAASTVLDYVQVKFGSGIALSGASPTLNRVSSLNHLGAAFAIDLASSPVGQGLVATGNALNGISVPADDITGDVKWGLTGIPYVVTQGVVGIGVTQVLPTISVPASVLVSPGNVLAVPVTLSAPAPAGGVTVTVQSSNTAAATVASPVVIAAGTTTANANVTGVAPGSATLTASAAGYTSGAGSVLVAAIALDIQPAGPISIPQGVTQSYLVKLSQSAPAGGVTVSVADDGAGTVTTPASVTIAAGQALSAPIAVRGAQSGPTSITLRSAGLSSKTIAADVLGAGSLAFNRTTAPIGKLMQTAPADFAIQLRAGGAAYTTSVPVTVNLAASDPTKVTLPATVTVTAGASSASFTLAGVELAAALTIDATSAAGYAAPSNKLAASVIAPQLTLTLLDGARTTTAGTRDDFTVQLSVPGDPGAQSASAAIAVDVLITNPSPPGIVDGIYTAASGGTTVPQLVVPAGGTSVTGYVGLPTVAGSYTVTAALAGLASVTSPAQTVTSPALQLPAAVTIGAGLVSFGNAVSVTRTGSLAAPLTVTLSCAPAAVCAVPASVTIPASAASVAVPVTGIAAGTGTLAATSAGYTSASSAVTTVTPGFTVTAGTASTVIGGTIDLTVTLGVSGQIAQTSPTDVVVTLATAPPGVASTPPTVTIPANAIRVGSITATGIAPGNFTVSAARTGFATATSATLTIIDNRLQIAPVAGSVGIGQTLPMSVSIANAAASNVAVTLTSSSPAFVSVPGSVTIVQGATSASFNATGVATGPSTITAHASGYIDATATVTAGSLALSLPPKSLVAPGYTRTLTVTLSAAAPAGGLVVTLASANPSQLSVPASVTLPAGATTATFDIQGVARGFVNVTASAPGATSAVCQVVVSPIRLDLVPQQGYVDIPQGVTQAWQVQWVLPPGLGGFAPTDNFTIDLASADAATATVAPPSVTLPVGQQSASVTITGVATGLTTFTLSSPGVPDAVIDVNVLEAGSLNFVQGMAIVGKGMIAPYAEVQLRRGSTHYITPVPVTIALANPDPTKATLPAAVEVPAYNWAAFVPITGVDLTASLVVTASTTTGYGSTPVPIVVQPPALAFYSLDGDRIVAGGRDQFFVDIAPPGGNLAQWLVNPATVALSITDAAPAGIVGTFHDQASGGSTITQLVFPAGQQTQLTVKGFVGQPTTAGTYSVTGTVSGLTSGTSSTQTVAATGTLEFMRGSVVVGNGLRLPGFTLVRKVNGRLFASDDPVTVTLTNTDLANVTVPVSVTIPAKQSAVAFAIVGNGVTTVPAVIDAAATGYATPVKLDVSVVTPKIEFHNLHTVRTTGSARNVFNVGWLVPGSEFPFQLSAVDVNVALAVTDQNPAGVIAGIYDQSLGGNVITGLVIPAGNNRAAVEGYVGTPTAPIGSYTLTATATGIALAVSPVQSVTNVTPVVGFVLGNGVTLGVGMQTDEFTLIVARTVQGYLFYGADAVDITLTSSDPTLATIPEVVSIPAESEQASIQMTGLISGNLTLTFTAPGYASSTAPVAVVMPQLEFQLDPDPTVSVGGTLPFYVNVVVPNGFPFNQYVVGENIQLTVTSSDPAIGMVTVPSTFIPITMFQAFSELMGVAPGTFTLRAEALSGGAYGAVVVSPPIMVVP